MKNLALIIVVMFLAAGCQLYDQTPDTFEEVHARVEAIDAAHNTTYSQERLGEEMADLTATEVMVPEIEALIEEVNRTPFEDSEEKESALHFLEARRLMLESQKSFQLGYAFGNEGLVADGFRCKNEARIRQSIGHFNRSITTGLTALHHLDEALTKKYEVTSPIIGVDENRPKFYGSPFQRMGHDLRINKDLVDKTCVSGVDEDRKFVPEEGTYEVKAPKLPEVNQ